MEQYVIFMLSAKKKKKKQKKNKKNLSNMQNFYNVLNICSAATEKFSMNNFKMIYMHHKLVLIKTILLGFIR